jgi:alpha-mannosidase
VSKSNGAVQRSERPETTSFPQLDGMQGSFLEVGDANVLLETWKPAEDGNGTILRFVDLGGAERVVTARMPYLHLGRVSETDAVERGQTPVSMVDDNEFRFTIHPHEIVTIRVVERRE